MITCIFYFHQLAWNGPTDMSTHLSRRSGGRGRGERKKGGGWPGKDRRGSFRGGPHFVLLLEAFLFSFLLSFERRVKTKWNICKWHKSRNGIFKQSTLTTLKAFVCMTAKWTYRVVDWNSLYCNGLQYPLQWENASFLELFDSLNIQADANCI